MTQNTSDLLHGLGERIGERFDVSAARLADYRRATAANDQDDSCITCDVPKDKDSCETVDVACSQQHDYVCVFCDEGDVGKKQCVPGIGDIPCGSADLPQPPPPPPSPKP
jgi:hypothetical protein